VQARHRAGRRRGVGDRLRQTVTHREPRAPFVVVDVPHACILPQATPRPVSVPIAERDTAGPHRSGM
jgi:hypothetical protein